MPQIPGFPDRVRDTLARTGLTPYAFALQHHIGADALYRLLKGENPDVMLSTAAQWAIGLHVSLDYLAGRTDDPTPPEK
jgi:hypothetical protein